MLDLLQCGTRTHTQTENRLLSLSLLAFAPGGPSHSTCCPWNAMSCVVTRPGADTAVWRIEQSVQIVQHEDLGVTCSLDLPSLL